MTERKSIMLYLDAEQQWDMLTDSQAGVLIKALLRYSKTGERIQTDDGMVAMAFSFMAAQIDRDGEKWDAKCKKNAENVKKRWERTKQTDTTVYERIPTITKHTDTDTVTDTDTDTVTDTDTDTVTDTDIIAAKPQEKRSAFTPPTVEEVAAYCQERKNGIDAQHFVDFYTCKGWMVGKTKMKDWRASVRVWERNGAKRKAVSSQPAKQEPEYDPEIDDFWDRVEGKTRK